MTRELADDEVLRVEAVVRTDGTFDLYTLQDASRDWLEVRRAMVGLRDDLTRQIEQGPEKCPFSPFK